MRAIETGYHRGHQATILCTTEYFLGQVIPRFLVGSSQIRILYFVSAGGVELHTCRFANVMPDFRVDEVARLEATARYASEKSLIVNAGHWPELHERALDVGNPLLGIPYWKEFNIGHSMCPEAFSSAWNPP